MAFIENLEEIKFKLNAEQVIDFIQPGKKKKIKGDEIRTSCPVHKGEDPNFSINIQTQAWNCHSHGCKGTNLIDLTAQSESISFIEAAESLAKQFGIPIKYKDKAKEDYTPEDVSRCWKEAKQQGKDTYFSVKKLSPPPIAKFGKNPYGYYSTLIPMVNIEGKFKRFITLKTGQKKYNYIYDDKEEAEFTPLGEIQQEGSFYIGEGIATVQTAWEATQRKIPAVSIGSWSNFLPVIRAIKTKYPNSKPIFLIDCDANENGLNAARAVAKEFPDVTFRKPSFDSYLNSGNEKPKDFNDIISKCNQSLDEVRRQLSIEFDLSSINENSKKETLEQKETPAIKTDSKTHGRCETAEDALKKMGLIDQIKNRIVEYRKSGEFKLSGIPTNYPKLDEIIDGLQSEQLIILGGRTGMGKTYLALNLLKNICISQRIPASLFSLEMSNKQVFYRLASLLSGVPAKKIKRGIITNEELITVEKAFQEIANSPLLLTDDPMNSNLNVLCKNIESSCKAGETKAVFIDHIGLVNCGKGFKDGRTNEMGNITRTCKCAAKQFDIPIICLAQLNREAHANNRPKLSQLRDSGSLEQDADVVIFIHRPDYYDKNEKPGQALIIVEKNRDNEVGEVWFDYSSNNWLLKESPPIKDLMAKVEKTKNSDPIINMYS